MRLRTFARIVRFMTVAFTAILSYSPCFAADVTENVVEKARGDDTSVQRQEGRSAGDRRKKDDLRDPRKLAEIIDKAIQISGEAGGAESPGLELPVKGVITSKVGLRHDPIDGDLRMHKGIDIAVPEGTGVYPVAPGTVVYSGIQSGYGNMVIVRHADGMITIYAHHSRNSVRTGDAVERKTRIAWSGSTGRSTGPHLHFEAWQGGRNVTRAFLPNFAGFRITPGSDASLDRTNLRKVIMADGTILFVEVQRVKNEHGNRGQPGMNRIVTKNKN